MDNSSTPFNNFLYESLFHEYPDAVIALDPKDHSILDVNETAVTLFGYSRDEFASMHLADLFPYGKSQPLVQTEVNRRLLREKRIFETECAAKNGELLELEVLSKVAVIEGREINLSVVKDIRERRTLEKELRQCQSLMESVVDSPSHINIWSFDREYRYTFFNRAHEKGMKEVWDRDISLGDSILDKITDPEYRKEVRNSYDTLLRGTPLISTDTLSNSEGTTQHFENYGSPVRDIRGEVVGGTIFTVEITKRVTIAEQFAKTVALLQSIMNSPPDIIILSIDREYRYTFFNNAHREAMMEFWGAEPKIGDCVLTFLTDPKYKEDVRTHYDKTLSGETWSTIDTFLDSKGKTKYYENISAPVENDMGDIIGVTVFIIDVTERVEVETQLKESLKEKEVLLREVHHRVKNNLQIISSLLNMQAATIGSKKAKNALIESQNRITSMALIHEQLYQSESIAHIEIEEYLQAVSGFISESHHIKRENLSIIYEIRELSVDIDQAIPMGLIVNELISNSIKYGREKEKHTKIWVRCYPEREDHIMRIEVEDNGPGYPEAGEIRKVRSLGLKLVEALAEQLGGSFEINNSPGAKSTVVFPFQEPIS